MANLPYVSVLMPVRNESVFIERSLTAVLSQDYPSDRMEVIVADGLSADNTRQIINQISAQYSNVQLIDNPRGIVATGLNAALRIAKGDVIIRVDGHTIINSDYVRECVSLLKESGADNVGGRMCAVSESRFGSAVAAATSSRFGVGGALFHYLEREEWVDTVYLGAWPRDIFRTVGTFDEEMVRNQDDEFNYRLRAAGGRILLSPRIRSSYFNRSTARSLWKQYFEYGFWKVRVFQKHPRQMQPRQFVPAFFILLLAHLVLTSPVIRGSRLMLLATCLAYLTGNLTASTVAAARAGWRLLPVISTSFMVIHFAYGCGFLAGLFRLWNRWEFFRRANVAKPSHDTSLQKDAISSGKTIV